MRKKCDGPCKSDSCKSVKSSVQVMAPPKKSVIIKAAKKVQAKVVPTKEKLVAATKKLIRAVKKTK